MKSDIPKVSPRQEKPQAQDSVMSGGWSGNNNGYRTNERSRVCDEGKAEGSGKPTVSLRKVESNRRNSQKSTGPKTATGKKRVSRNAVRHGFFSKFLLIQHPGGKESQSEYNDFYDGVRKHYQPVGWLEEAWGEKIAVWSWRLRHLIRFESGQIALALARAQLRPAAIKSRRSCRTGLCTVEQPGNRCHDRSSLLAGDGRARQTVAL